jgi:hypothetical protein
MNSAVVSKLIIALFDMSFDRCMRTPEVDRLSGFGGRDSAQISTGNDSDLVPTYAGVQLENYRDGLERRWNGVRQSPTSSATAT